MRPPRLLKLNHRVAGRANVWLRLVGAAATLTLVAILGFFAVLALQSEPRPSEEVARVELSRKDRPQTYSNVAREPLSEMDLQELIKKQEAQLREQPTNWQVAEDLSDRYSDLAAVMVAQQRTAEGEVQLRRAIQGLELLRREHPHDTLAPKLTKSYLALGQMLTTQSRGHEAQASFQQAVSLADEISKRPTATPADRDQLAGCLVDLGLAQRSQGIMSDAGHSFEKAIAIRQSLFREHPAKSEYREGLAWCYVYLALAQESALRQADAIKSYQQAMALREQLVKDRPDSKPLQNQLAAVCVELGIMYRNLRQLTLAIELGARSVELRRRLVEAEPENFDYRAGLGWSNANLGVTQLVAGKSADAVLTLRQAVEVREKLVTAQNTVNDHLVALGWSNANLSAALLADQKPADARHAAQKALKVRAKLVQDNPGSADWRHDLAVSSRDLAHIERALGHLDEARTYYQLAVEIHQKLVDEFPQSEVAKANLVGTVMQAAETAALASDWEQSARLYCLAAAASNFDLRVLSASALAHLVAGDEKAYRATCAELFKRHPMPQSPRAGEMLVLCLSSGSHALVDLGPVVELARKGAESEPEGVAPLLWALARLRNHEDGATIVDLAKALALWEAPPKRDDERTIVLVARLLGEAALSRAYLEETGKAIPAGKVAAIQSLTEKTEAIPVQQDGLLPPWIGRFAAAVAKKQLTSQVTVAAPAP